MSSDVAPLLVGFAAAGMLLVVIGIVLAIRRLLERIRLTSSRQSREYEGWATSQEWIYRPRAPRAVRAEPLDQASKAEGSAGDPSGGRQSSLAAVDEARHRAGVMLAIAERRCERLLRESDAEAERRAGEIIEDALRQARELLEDVEPEVENVTTKGVPTRSAPGV